MKSLTWRKKPCTYRRFPQISASSIWIKSTDFERKFAFVHWRQEYFCFCLELIIKKTMKIIEEWISHEFFTNKKYGRTANFNGLLFSQIKIHMKKKRERNHQFFVCQLGSRLATRENTHVSSLRTHWKMINSFWCFQKEFVNISLIIDHESFKK